MRSLTNLRLGTYPRLWWFVAVVVLMVGFGLTAIILLYPHGSAQAQSSPSSTKSITLSWVDPGGGAGYQFSTDHGVTWDDVSFIGDSSFGHTISRPASGTATVFLLRATGAGYRVVNPAPPPVAALQQAGTSGGSAPALAAQSTGPQTITLVWTAPTQGAGTPVALYELDWSPDGSGSSWKQLARVNSSSGTSYDDNEVHVGVTRHYRVRAVDASFNYGPWSQSVSTTVAEPSPNTPILAALPTQPGTIRLTWTAPAGARQGSDVAKYNLEWSPDGSDNSWVALTDIHYPERQDSYEDLIAYGTTRYYRIRAVDNSRVASPWSQVVNATATFPPPTEPQADAQAVGRDSVYIHWYEMDGQGIPVTKLELEVSSDGGNSFAALERNLSPSSLSYMHSGLQPGAARVYRLRGCSSSGCGDWGVTSQVTVGAEPVPTAPVLTASARNSSIIALTWTQPDDGGSSITRYDIQTTDDSGNWDYSWSDWVIAERLWFEHGGLDAGETAHFRVRARNGNGEGVWSAVKSATSGASGAPAAPENLNAVVAGDHQVDLSWDAPQVTTGITGYRLERANMYTGRPWELAVITSKLSHSDTGLDAGTGYEYRVAAVNSVGTGDFSGMASAVTNGTAVRGGAPALIATPLAGVIELTWTEPPPMSPACDVRSYEVERSPDGTSGSWEHVADRDADHTKSFGDSVDPGSLRHYRVRAVYWCGFVSPWSKEVSATSTHFPPHTPFLMGVVAGQDSIHLEWEVPDHERKSISRYEIQVSSDGGATYRTVNARVDASAVSHTFARLESGASLVYGVRACNSDACSEWAATQELTVGQNPVPTSPGLQAAVISSAEIALTWTQPDDGGSDITAYEVHESHDGIEWEREQEVDPDRQRLLVEGLDGGTTLHFRVRALNGNGQGVWSNVVTPTTIAGAPSAPSALDATAAGDHQIDLTWEEATNPSGNNSVIRYRVERVDLEASDGDWEDEWELVTTTTALSHSDTGLYEGSYYYYRVAAVNDAGRGPWDWPVGTATTGKTPSTPARPTLLHFASLGVNRVTIAWDVPESDGGRPVTGYLYEVASHCSNWETSVHETTDKRVEIADLPACADGYDFRVSAVNAIGEGDWTFGLYGRVPTSSNGRVIVQPTSLRIPEGGSSSFTIKLGQAPTKDLNVLLSWEGDNDLFDSVWDEVNNDNTLTPDNWQEGLTFRLNLAEDEDAVNGSAVLSINLYTKDDRPYSEQRANPKPPEPVFDGQAGAAILAVEVDND